MNLVESAYNCFLLFEFINTTAKKFAIFMPYCVCKRTDWFKKLYHNKYYKL